MNIKPEIIEKDYFVTVFLKKLVEKMPEIIFKGGTSFPNVIPKMFVHFSFKHLLDRSAHQVLESVLDILCGLDIIHLDQLCYDILLALAHWFSFSSSHKYSASCVISILPQFADFLQTFFRGSFYLSFIIKVISYT